MRRGLRHFAGVLAAETHSPDCVALAAALTCDVASRRRFASYSDDHYVTLGVPEDATPQEIKKAFYTLSKRCHPDLHSEDKAMEEKFKNLSIAYEVLNNPQKRRAYDVDLRGSRPARRWNQKIQHPAAMNRQLQYSFTGADYAAWRERRRRAAMNEDDQYNDWTDEWIKYQRRKMWERMDLDQDEHYRGRATMRDQWRWNEDPEDFFKGRMDEKYTERFREKEKDWIALYPVAVIVFIVIYVYLEYRFRDSPDLSVVAPPVVKVVSHKTNSETERERREARERRKEEERIEAEIRDAIRKRRKKIRKKERVAEKSKETDLKDPAATVIATSGVADRESSDCHDAPLEAETPTDYSIVEPAISNVAPTDLSVERTDSNVRPEDTTYTYDEEKDSPLEKSFRDNVVFIDGQLEMSGLFFRRSTSSRPA